MWRSKDIIVRLGTAAFLSISMTVMSQDIVFNEVHYDPSNVGFVGDANGDGVLGLRDDEFIEIVNSSTNDVDITDWSIMANGSPLFTFPSTILTGKTAVVVFGGGTPSGLFGAAQIFTAGWAGLNNQGITLALVDGVITNDVLNYSSYANNPNASFARSPDGTGTVFELHTTLHPCGLPFSPGTASDGSGFVGSGITNTPPCILSLADGHVQVDQLYNQTILAFDLDGDPITLTVAGAPTSTVFVDEGGGLGQLTYTGQVADAGQYFEISVTASDPASMRSRAFSLYIVETNYTGLVINEYLADPNAAGGIFIDSNQDAVEDTSEDEFVEVLNFTGQSLDMADFTLHDSSTLRHRFAPRVLPNGGSIVIFGGGSLLNFTNQPAQRSSTGGLDLQQLNGDEISLWSPATTLVDQVTYAIADQAESATRHPDFSGSFTNHYEATGNLLRASPGAACSGLPFLTNHPPVWVFNADQYVAVSNQLILPARAYDPADGDVVTLTASNLPMNSSFDSIGGVGTLTFTPDASQATQTFTVDLIATDVDGAETSTVQLIVVAMSTAEEAWINEIHYDNDGSDVNEGIEIAGTSGTDLNNYYILHYNGNGGGIVSSNNLSGIIDTEECGYGARWFGISPLQNDEDGVALAKGDQLIQFISWEGPVTATVGIANGMISQVLPVVEAGTTPVAYSLQLIGTGTQYSAFTWAPPVLETRDTLNAGQVMNACGAGLSFQKTVYAGHDSGASCPGGELVQGVNATLITFCFSVTNTGEVAFNNVTIEDPGLPDFVPVNLGPLPLGASASIYFETEISGDRTNSAHAIGSPQIGDPITATNTAIIDEVHPEISLQKTVYGGHDSGQSGPGVELLVETNGANITYYFSIENSGDVTINDLTLTDVGLGYGPTNFGSVVAGQVVTTFIESTVSGDLVNTGEVTGMVGAQVVSDADIAEVDEIHPALILSKTVYIGHDNGASCPGTDLVAETNSAPLTYCFVIENVGDVPLEQVTLEDAAIGFGPIQIGTMSAGQIVTSYTETILFGGLINTARVIGVATGKLVEAVDTSEVQEVIPPVDCVVYEIIDLGTLGGTGSAARAVNDYGQVVGWALDADNKQRAFLWENGVMADVGSLPGYPEAEAYDINNRSCITGRLIQDPDTNYVAFLWSNNVMSSIGTLGGAISIGTAMNEANTIVGYSLASNRVGVSAMLWTNGVMIDCRTFHQSVKSSTAWGVDKFGHVVGISHMWNPNDFWMPYIWNDINGNFKDDDDPVREMRALGTLGGAAGIMRDINDSGIIVGHVFDSAGNAPGLLITPEDGVWSKDENHDGTNDLFHVFGTLPGGTYCDPESINDAGIIVGQSEIGGGGFHAFLYKDEVLIDLNDYVSNWVLTAALDINNSGLICGHGVVGGETHGFLLVPCRDEIVITAIECVLDNQSNEAVKVVWQGEGFNLQYTLERRDNAMAPSAWEPLVPTNTWPTIGRVWQGSSSLVTSSTIFRVKGVGPL